MFVGEVKNSLYPDLDFIQNKNIVSPNQGNDTKENTIQKSPKQAENSTSIASSKNKKNKAGIFKELSPEEQRQVEELRRIDQKVRAHERAHIAAGGNLVRSAANYTYQTGPDGKQYVVAGEVTIDMSYDPEKPEEAIQKMQQVRRAALAPADPSPQDRAVAQQASNIEAQMRAKLLKERANQSIEQNSNSFGNKSYNPAKPNTPTNLTPYSASQPVQFSFDKKV